MLIGIVGKPNVGKSTLFKAFTMADAEAANYPFTTIDPNKGVGFVRVKCVEDEFNVKCNPRVGYCVDGVRYVPVDVIDVAGLVPGAHEGRGLGNKFLDDLRNADVLIHVVDASGSTNEKGEVVSLGSYDPLQDIEFLEYELDMWIAQVLQKNWEKVAKTQASKKQKLVDALRDIVSGLSVKEYQFSGLLKNYPELMIDWTPEQIRDFASQLRKRSKPIVIAANKYDLPTSEGNIKRIKEKYPNLLVIPISAQAELVLKEMDKAGKLKYIPGANKIENLKSEELSEREKKGIEIIQKCIIDKNGSTGVQEIVERSVFDILKYIAIFPGGVSKLADSQGRILPDCFLLHEGSTALDFAFTIHSDLGNKFIKAILVRNKTMVGKEHELKHRDIVEIVSGR